VGMPSCRTSAAATTNSLPTRHRRSAWPQHSPSSRRPCDLRLFQTRRLPPPAGRNRPAPTRTDPTGWSLCQDSAGSTEVVIEHRSSTVRAPRPPCGRPDPDDHRDQRTSRRPGFRHRTPFEHRSVHSGHSNDLVCRISAGHSLVVSAPPGTRTRTRGLRGQSSPIRRTTTCDSTGLQNPRLEPLGQCGTPIAGHGHGQEVHCGRTPDAGVRSGMPASGRWFRRANSTVSGPSTVRPRTARTPDRRLDRGHREVCVGRRGLLHLLGPRR
jgi:hypothetical protein